MTTDHDLERRLRAVLAADADRLDTAALSSDRVRHPDDRVTGAVTVIPLPGPASTPRRTVTRVMADAASAAVIAASAVGVTASRSGHSGGVGAAGAGVSDRSAPQQTASTPRPSRSGPPHETPAQLGERFFRDFCVNPKTGLEVRTEPGMFDSYGPVHVLADGETSRQHWRSFYRVGTQYAFYGVCSWGLAGGTLDSNSVMGFHRLSDVPGRSSAPFDWTTYDPDQFKRRHQLYFMGFVPSGASTVDLLNRKGVRLGRVSGGQVVSPGTKLIGGAIAEGQVASAVCYDAEGRKIARLVWTDPGK